MFVNNTCIEQSNLIEISQVRFIKRLLKDNFRNKAVTKVKKTNSEPH